MEDYLNHHITLAGGTKKSSAMKPYSLFIRDPEVS
jgi:hypothetical protein